MNNFYSEVLDQAGVFSSFITASILFFKTTGSQRHANRLLGLVVFALGWYALLYLLGIDGILRNYPHLFRVGSPLYYLVPPCAYIYVRSVLFDETRFRKWDWLNLLPAVLHLIDLLPFYLQDTETKRRVVEAISTHIVSGAFMGSGLIPASWHFVGRGLQGLIYLCFQWSLLFRFFRGAPSRTAIKGWLFSFSTLLTLLYLGIAYQSVMLLLLNRPALEIRATSDPSITVMSLCFVALSGYLLFKPEILYGIIRLQPMAPVAIVLEEEVQITPSAKAPKRPIDDDILHEYAERIGNTIQDRQLFKKKGLTLAILAQDLGIPAHHLSYMLRHFFKQQFNDFINRYRVAYIKDRMQEKAWIKMTLEAHATEAGFSSRSTFFTAFKRLTGVTPSEYARVLHQSSLESVPDAED